jgi:PadR family transcriptional regulator PadR
VLDVLTQASDDNPAYGLRVCDEADLGPGTVYPILERLAEIGWIESWREVEQPPGRPRRRYYRMTGTGRVQLAEARAARAERRRRWVPFTPRPEGGEAS